MRLVNDSRIERLALQKDPSNGEHTIDGNYMAIKFTMISWIAHLVIDLKRTEIVFIPKIHTSVRNAKSLPCNV